MQNGKTHALRLGARKKKLSNKTAAPLSGARFLSASEVMPMLGYSDRSAFWQACKSAGIPFIRINARRCVFEESSVRSWLDSRTVGRVSPRGGEIA